MIPEEILFVFGPARGGTTFLTDILYDGFDYSMGPEGAFIADVVARIPSYGNLADDGNIEKLLADLRRVEMLEIMRNRWPAGKRIDITLEALRRNLPERSAAGAVYAVLASVREARGKRHIGIKNPGYWRQLDVLETTFGSRARYICIMRDGRDVALSNYLVPWGQQNAWSCAQTWTRMCEAVDRFRTRVDPHRFFLLRYEDLLADPQANFGKLQDFLGVGNDVPARDQLVKELMGSKLRTNFGKWKTRMSSRDVRIFEAVAGSHLRQFGYDVATTRPYVRPDEVLTSWAGETLRKVRLTLGRAWTRRRP